MLSRLHEMMYYILILTYLYTSQDGKIKWNLKYEKSEPVIAATTPFLVINQVTYGLRYSRMDQVKFVEDSLRPCYFKFLKAVFHKFYLVHS